MASIHVKYSPVQSYQLLRRHTKEDSIQLSINTKSVVKLNLVERPLTPFFLFMSTALTILLLRAVFPFIPISRHSITKPS